jgi:hypothetical protein
MSSEGQQNPQQGESEIPLNIPKRTADGAYIYRLIGALATHNSVFANLKDSSEPNLVSVTRETIIAVIDDEIRNELLDSFERSLNVIENYECRTGDRNKYIVKCCQMAVAEVYSFLDEFSGVSKTMVIGDIYRPPPKKKSMKEDGDSEPYLTSEKDEEEIVVEEGVN